MRIASLFVAITLAAATAANAQARYQRATHEGFATRAELESLVADAERAMASGSLPVQVRNSKEATAFVIRQRLREGDFQAGDRIAVLLDGAVKLNDTVAVRTGRTILLPELPAISLAGVLRSELQGYLTTQIGRYIRDPQLQTRPLLRVSVTGAVGRPGFYSVPADALLSDVITLAGGPTARVEFGKSIVRRGTEELWGGKSVETALSDGMTVDALLLQSGDEVVVGEKRATNWFGIVQGVATVGGIASLLLTLTRRR